MSFRGVRVGCWGYTLAFLLAVGGCGGCVGSYLEGGRSARDKMIPLDVPSRTRITLPEAGVYWIAPDPARKPPPKFDLQIRNIETGETPVLHGVTGIFFLSEENAEEQAAREFEITAPGTFNVAASFGDGSSGRLNIFPSPAAYFNAGPIIFGIGGLLSVLTGILTFILSRRAFRKKGVDKNT